MNRLVAPCLVTVVLAAGGCGLLPDGPAAVGRCGFLNTDGPVQLQGVAGTIDTLAFGEDPLYLFIADCDQTVVFAVTGALLPLDNLPNAFKQEGLRVVISGTPVPIPAHLRLPAGPLEIAAIRKAD